MSVRLAEIVACFGGELIGSGETEILRIMPLEQAGVGDLAFLANPKYRHQLAQTQASAVILAEVFNGLNAAILTPQPYLYFARVAQWLNPPPSVTPGIHPTAVVEGEVNATASVGPNTWVGKGARIGAGVVVGANCSIGADSSINEDSRLAANVSVYAGCRLGKRCLIHSGVVIGADGFGFARDESGAGVKIPQLGGVSIGDDVEIGANTTIDRGTFGDTVIGNGVKLDNQVQIGHNVKIGEHTALTGCVGVAGSATIGARCLVGGGAIILGHLSIVDDVTISAGTLVAKSIGQPGHYTGTVPSQPHADWLKNFSHLRHLEAMADKIRGLEERLARLEREK